MANKEAKNVTGFTAEELIGSRWTDHVTPAGLKMMQQFHETRRTNPGEAPNKYEVDLIHKSGDIRRTLLTIGMIPDSEFSLVTLIDITKRYRATEKLREHKNKLTSIFRAAPIGIGLLSQRRLLEVNDYLCKLLNYSKDELIGQNARILYPSQQDYDFVGREKYRQIAENGTGSVKTRFQTKEGDILDVLLSSTPIDSKDWNLGVTFTVLDITEQKKAEAEINLLANSLKNINECVSITDLDDNLIFVNDSFLQTYGYSREEVMGKNIDLVDSPQNSPQVNAEIMPATLAGGWSGELWNRRKDGSVFPISLSTKIINDQQGEPIALIGVAKDISEKKQAEAKLKNQYRLLKIAGETAKFGAWHIDLKTNISHWSDVVAAIHEVPSGFAPQVEDGFNFYAPKWREKIREVFLACAQQGISYDEEMQIITAKGKHKWIRTIGNAVRNEKNEITMINGAFQDITERKTVEEALRASEEKYRRIADNVTDVVWVIDLEMNPTYISPSVERVFGLKPQDYLQLPLSQTYPPASLEKIQKKLAEEFAKEQDPQVAQDRVFHLELERYYSDGSMAWDVISASFIRDEEGKPIAIQGVSHDITETKQAQEELRQNQENLAITLDSIGDGVISTNIAGEIVNINPVAEKMCGWTKKQALGKQLSEVFKIYNSKSEERIEDPVKKVIKCRDVVGLANHTVLLSKDGKEYQIADSAAPIKNAAGEILGVVIVFSDFSEKYANQKKLAESEEKFRTLANSAKVMISIVADAKGAKYLYVNDEWQHVTGYSKAEALQLKPIDLVDEEYRQKVLDNAVKRAQGNASEASYELKIITKSGEFKYLDFSAKMIKFGEQKAYLTTTIDITERKKAEEQIRESEITFRKLFEESSDPILLINKEDVFVECNQATLDLLGMTREQFISLTPAEISPEFQPDGRSSKLAAQEMINLAYQNGLHRFDWTHVNSKGEPFIVDISLMPVVLKEKTMLHTTWRDITERKQYEAEIKQLLQEKETLLREVHHRVKNNLGVVQSMLSLQAIAEENQNCKMVLEEAAGRLQSMLMLYNKLYRSEIKRDLSLQVFLPPLINEIAANFKEIVTIESDLKIPDIVLDPKILVPLGIIMNEFITNSVKYSFETNQSGKITIRACQKDDTVRLTYADGTAMVDPELFAHSDTFGLKLIQLMIKQIRGAITIDQGKSTKYVIDFPI
jgi:PAS domain S-box-containing protein